MHLTFQLDGCLVRYVASEVRLAALPTRAREALFDGLAQSVVGVAGGDLHAFEAPAFELAEETLPGRLCLSKGHSRALRSPAGRQR